MEYLQAAALDPGEIMLGNGRIHRIDIGQQIDD
jgi:hypothetical protein